MNEIWKEGFRILKPDGKLVINIADISTSTKYYGRRKIYPIHSKIIENYEKIGFDYYDFLIWYKPHREFKKIYGSYPYPTNYQFFMVFEYILIFRKWMNEEYFRKRKSPPEEMKTESKISKKDWIPWASNVWEISPIIKFNHKGKNLRKHIVPFPEETPYGLVKLFSFQQDLVLQRGTGIRSQHLRS